MEWIFIFLCFAVVTALAASSKGRSAAGWFVLGFLFSLFALIAVLVMPSIKREQPTASNSAPPTDNTHRPCPDCAEPILLAAKVCKHCGLKLPTEAAKNE